MTQCSHCDREATMIQVANPFTEEIYDEIVLEDFCEECYQNACDDI